MGVPRMASLFGSTTRGEGRFNGIHALAATEPGVVTGSDVEVPMGGGRATTAYVSLPPAGSGSAVLLLPPIFGVTPGIKIFADRIAAEDFVVAAPDMFWRTLPGPLGYEGTDREKAQERYRNFDVGLGVRDVEQLIGWLKARPEVTGGVGVMGLCFGGRYAFLAAAGRGADAAVSYHGTYIEAHLDECRHILAKTSLHFGENDPHVPMAQVERIRDAARTSPNIEIHTYAGAGHGFMQQDRPSYNADVADLAFARGLALLKSELNRGGKP